MRLDYAMRVMSLMATVVYSPVRLERLPVAEPRVDRVQPAVAKAGAIITGFGVSLDRLSVADLVLSRGDMTVLTHIVEQQDGLIRFRVPRSAPAGKYRIVLVVPQLWGPALVDQQCFLEILPGSVISRSVPPVGANGA